VRLSITAIIVSYNSSAVLADCIRALSATLSPARILVVDNSSVDGSAVIAQKCGADIIVNSSNLGYGAACNVGAKTVTTDLMIFVNPDVCITAIDDLELSRIAAKKPLGLVAPRTLNEGLAEDVAPSTRRASPWPISVVREAVGPLIPRKLTDWIRAVDYVKSGKFWLSGAVLLCARSEFMRLGGFDERLFLYYEDRELSLQYARRGLPLSITDAIAGRHSWGGSSGESQRGGPATKAASALSSIEFVAITRGPFMGRCAWWLYVPLSRTAVAVAWLAAHISLSRGAGKRDELEARNMAMAAFISEESPCYPFVKALARK
jgi:N-acetylglucosaminyl-diphospho-decaprenol L-rhamnosyltransferase